MTELDYNALINVALVIISAFFGTWYAKSKNKISQAKQLLKDIEISLYDDNVSEKEFRNIFDQAKRLINN